MAKKTYIKVSGVWKEVTNIWRKVSGVWQDEVMSWIRVSGTWKECMEYAHVSASPDSLIFSTSGGSQNSTISSSGAWTSSIQSDPDSIITGRTLSGNDQDTCTIWVGSNGDMGTKQATVRITCGGVYDDIDICQDGTMEECA